MTTISSLQSVHVWFECIHISKNNLLYQTVSRCGFKTHISTAVTDGQTLGDRKNGISVADCRERCQDDSACTHAEYIEVSGTVTCQLYNVVRTSSMNMYVTLFEKNCSSANSGKKINVFLTIKIGEEF